MQSDQPTSNGRIYCEVGIALQRLYISQVHSTIEHNFSPQSVLRKAAQAYHQQYVLTSTSFGAFGHPHPTSSFYYRVSWEFSSHQVQSHSQLSYLPLSGIFLHSARTVLTKIR